MDIDSEHINQLLQEAGWTDGRAIDTSDYELLFEENRLPVSPAAIEILREFGGIRIEGAHPYTQSNFVWLDIDPVFACDVQSIELLRDCSMVLKRNLTPIGMANQGEWVLLVDEEGQIYANHDLDIYYVGDTIREAIQILCKSKQKKLEKIGRVN